jgi:ribosome-associated heat shock protein Hsp15
MMAEIRLDKWLWAARFFKTRGLAADAVSGGKVHLNGARTKPAKSTRVGDEVEMRRGPYTTVVVVRALGDRRGPASEAQQLYEETEASRTARETLAAQLRTESATFTPHAGKPSKRDRREGVRLRRGD